VVTPLEEAPPELAAERHLLLKREDLHELGAFKWRGALPALREYRGRGADAVVTASTGNHGAATAWAAARLGMRPIVFVPEAVSGAKAELLGALGVELRPEGADLDDAKELARAHTATSRLYGCAAPDPEKAFVHVDLTATEVKVRLAADLFKSSGINTAIADRKVAAMSESAVWFTRALLLIIVLALLLAIYAVTGN
jgi:cysteine synthase